MAGYWRTSASRTSTSQPTATSSRIWGSSTTLSWPILTHQQQRPAARVLDGALCRQPAQPGSDRGGTVVRSVLGPGVVVETGALVRDSVVFQDTRVQEGACLDWTVVDRDCVIGVGAEVGSPDADPDDPDDIVLVGRGSRIGPGVAIARGGRLEPGTTA